MAQATARTRKVAFASAMMGAVLLSALAVMVVLAWRQGVWIDEIWSLWMSERQIPLATAFHERWMHDAHPPLFHFSNWALSSLIGENIFGRRLLNLAPAAFLAAVCLFVWYRSTASRPFVLVFAVLLLTSRAALWYFPEHRSYFAVVCVVGALCVLVHETFQTRQDLDLRRDRDLAALLALTILLSVNLHYITVAVAGAVLGVAFLTHVWRGRRTSAGLIFIITALSLAPLLAGLAAQLPYLAGTAEEFWIKTTPGQAAVMLAAAPLYVAANIVAAIAALIATFMSLRPRNPSAEDEDAAPSPAAWEFTFVLIAALVVASAALLAASVFKPILVQRYLVGMAPVGAASLAAIAAPLLLSRRWIVVLFCVNALVLTAAYAKRPFTSARWAATIQRIEEAVGACPTTRVYAIDPTFYPSARPANQPLIHDWGYQQQGRLHGFKVTILHADRAQAPAFSRDCPTLLWAEHASPVAAPPVFLRSPLARTPQMQARLADAKTFRGESGFIIDIPPATDRDPTPLKHSVPIPRD